MVWSRISRDAAQPLGAQPAVLGKTARRAAAFGLIALGLAGCVNEAGNSVLPDVPTRWDHRPEAQSWTAAAFVAVAEKDDILANRVPGDINTWCPGYKNATLNERRAFWVGLMSAVAKKESSHNPAASGGGGRYIGLMQISPATARGNGCDAASTAALKDGSENLECAVEVFSRDVARDGLVAGGGNRGIGRQWGPFRKSDARATMAAWTAKQPYCAKG
ncbi:transglycosylase SLT domain-containing protein [Xinfangfangia sp. CPCC 101601]|uniref:Transglycosylase SLT domain-containing protein n=1 Tax=Pseudogemmobacter lacusdianii TaxID=3069608 RepID=A0ABU0W0R4_9RHOB|nr:transglycosylase SLT domain-containing protein [Xinfangfangia sp. CPCC 101601]MDQ2067577.1 transglycosylase SLT domain-containing protein [Xinfangfangia sp. CPCC 101601]